MYDSGETLDETVNWSSPTVQKDYVKKETPREDILSSNPEEMRKKPAIQKESDSEQFQFPVAKESKSGPSYASIGVAVAFLASLPVVAIFLLGNPTNHSRFNWSEILLNFGGNAPRKPLENIFSPMPVISAGSIAEDEMYRLFDGNMTEPPPQPFVLDFHEIHSPVNLHWDQYMMECERYATPPGVCSNVEECKDLCASKQDCDSFELDKLHETFRLCASQTTLHFSTLHSAYILNPVFPALHSLWKEWSIPVIAGICDDNENLLPKDADATLDALSSSVFSFLSGFRPGIAPSDLSQRHPTTIEEYYEYMKSTESPRPTSLTYTDLAIMKLVSREWANVVQFSAEADLEGCKLLQNNVWRIFRGADQGFLHMNHAERHSPLTERTVETKKTRVLMVLDGEMELRISTDFEGLCPAGDGSFDFDPFYPLDCPQSDVVGSRHLLQKGQLIVLPQHYAEAVHYHKDTASVVVDVPEFEFRQFIKSTLSERM